MKTLFEICEEVFDIKLHAYNFELFILDVESKINLRLDKFIENYIFEEFFTERHGVIDE